MASKPKVKVVGFILRKNRARNREILLHSFETIQTLPLRLPGGGVDVGETVEQALERELYEESGFSSWQLGRKLGVQSYFKPYINADVERHDFLLWATSDIPDSWTHVVHGSGGDAGESFGFHWLAAGNLENIDAEHRPYINQTYLPELFESDL